MFCKNCGEENPDEAKFCKNCGYNLKEDVKKTEIIDEPVIKQNQENTSSATSSNDNNSEWLGCCLCLIGIFIVFAILGVL